jgi:hypothetical protein
MVRAGGAQMFKDAEAGDKEINTKMIRDKTKNRYNCAGFAIRC